MKSGEIMAFNDIIYEKLKTIRKKKFNLDDAAQITGLRFGFDKKTLEKTIKSLCKEGLVKKLPGGYFSCVSSGEPARKKGSGVLTCEIFGSERGYAFAREIGAASDNDIFIPENSLGGACHGDKVTVRLQSSKGKRMFGNKREGMVEKILERGTKFAVGTLRLNEGGVTLVYPDDTRFTDCIFISASDTMGAEDNTKVVVEILDYPARYKMAKGSVCEILGSAENSRVETLSIVRSFGLFDEFPEDVISEAESYGEVSESDFKGRVDYRDKLIITIDGEDAKDFDDAVSLSRSSDGYELGVFIADVSHYVKAGSALDREALRRGTSVYFPDYVIPMLPKRLSNDLCSLRPHEDRLVLAVVMKIAPDGKVNSYQINKGIISSSFRMTYNEVTAIFDGEKAMTEKYVAVKQMLFDMKELAEILIKRRKSAGEIDFDIPEPLIRLSEDGSVLDITRKPREMSDRIIEQFMVLTNEVVAKHFSSLKIPFVYRVHEEPSQKKVSDFAKFAGSLGLSFGGGNKTPTPMDYRLLLEKNRGKDYYNALSKVMLRSMQKARYETRNLGHFGLALGDYCHFTSPIRRYPDLIIHRIISEYISGELTEQRKNELEKFTQIAAMRSSETERNAEEAERTVDKQKEVEFMSGKVGEVFSGIISGVTENNIYVELENTIEGQINISKLTPGKYELNGEMYVLRGAGESYRIGDKILVRVAGVNIYARRIDFEPAEIEAKQQAKPRVKSKTGESKAAPAARGKKKHK